VLFLSDYDGTLTPIIRHPSEALLSPGVREKLVSLSQKPGYTVGVISGRSMPDLKSLVAIEGIYYAGNHGIEIEGPGLSFTTPEAQATRETIVDLRRKLAAALEGVDGLIVEDKGLGITVHYRQVNKDKVEAVTDTFEQITAPLVEEDRVRVSSGKKVLEVRPPIDWHKGKAVETIAGVIRDTLKIEPALTVYLGDDTTDEDAFRVVQPPSGWSVFVGGNNPSSAAAYYVDSPAEVEELLSRLLVLG
jgi:trehalose-phosphatase